MAFENGTRLDPDERFFLHRWGASLYCYGSNMAFRLSPGFLIQYKARVEFDYASCDSFLHPSWLSHGRFYAVMDRKLFWCSGMQIEMACAVDAEDDSLFIYDGELLIQTANGYLQYDCARAELRLRTLEALSFPRPARFFPVFTGIVAIAAEYLVHYVQERSPQEYQFEGPPMFANCGIFVDSAGYLVDVLTCKVLSPTESCAVEMLKFYYETTDYGLLPDRAYLAEFWCGFDVAEYERKARLCARASLVEASRRAQELEEPGV